MILPDFPWDTLAAARAQAQAHPDGIVDLSVGTPVDPTPPVLQEALRASANAPGYPQTHGTAPLREAVSAWFARRRRAPQVDPDGVLPTLGSKELVAWLPTLLQLGSGDVVAYPKVAYPTYDVGARLSGATPRPMSGLFELGPAPAPRLLWLNTPGNPTGEVLEVEHLAKVVRWARERGVIVASDECYAELDWRACDPASPGTSRRPGALSTPSVLDERVCDGSHEGLLAVYSLSKQSNLAGYRAAFVAGDPRIVSALLEIRKHAGMIVPWPVQQVVQAAVSDDAHVAQQKARYATRRASLRPALEAAGLRIEHSEAGLYLWATDGGTDGRGTVQRLAEIGILVAPGDFYGAAGRGHVRVALSATDERIAAAVSRLNRL